MTSIGRIQDTPKKRVLSWVAVLQASGWQGHSPSFRHIF